MNKNKDLHYRNVDSNDLESEGYVTRSGLITYNNFKESLFKGKMLLSGIVGIIITLTILWYLISKIKYEHFSALFQKINPLPLFAATIFYIVIYYFRSTRFRLMLMRQNIKQRDMFAIVSLHSFLNQILPFRIGELSYLYFQKKYHDIDYLESSAILICARILDILSLLFLGLIFFPALFLFNKIAYINIAFMLIFLLLIIISIIFLVKLLKSPAIRAIAENNNELSTKYNHNINIVRKFAGRLVYYTINIVEDFQFFNFIGLSLIIWITTLMYFYFALLGFGHNIDFLNSVIPAYGAIIGNLLPVNGIGSLGTFEAGFALGQISIGINSETSIPTAFIIHSHVILIALLLSFFSWLYLRSKK